MNSLKYDTVVAEPNTDYCIDFVYAETGLTHINGHTLEQVREEYPNAQIMSFDEYVEGKFQRQNGPIEYTEISEEDYDSALNCLPPVCWYGNAFLLGEPYDHCAKTGQARYIAYFGGKSFKCSNRPMTKKEFKSILGK